MQYDFTPGQNLVYTPRGDQRVTFQQLRTFAQSFDLCAMVLDKKKREIGSKVEVANPGQAWVPGEKKGDYRAKGVRHESKKDDYGSRKNHSTCFDSQTGIILSSSGPTAWLDDVLICDAGSILPVRNKLGDIFQLRVISGSTITPLLDEQGFVPAPPEPGISANHFGLAYRELSGDERAE